MKRSAAIAAYLLLQTGLHATTGCSADSGALEAEVKALREENRILHSEIEALKAVQRGSTASPVTDKPKGMWPPAAKDAYVERCAESMHSQGLPLENAQPYCRCFVERAEREFGKSDYVAMMKAQPDRKGSESDQRLYQLFKACSHHLENAGEWGD